MLIFTATPCHRLPGKSTHLTIDLCTPCVVFERVATTTTTPLFRAPLFCQPFLALHCAKAIVTPSCVFYRVSLMGVSDKPMVVDVSRVLGENKDERCEGFYTRFFLKIKIFIEVIVYGPKTGCLVQRRTLFQCVFLFIKKEINSSVLRNLTFSSFAL